MKQRYLAFTLAALLAGVGPLATLHADTAAALPDFSGAWRLDDTNSDNEAAVTKLLQDESQSEQNASDQQAPAATPSPTEHAGLHGRRGGGGHKKDKDDKKADDEPAKPREYPLPPTLKTDSVLLIQQDSKSVQVRLNSGDTLNGRLDGQSQQSLNGAAIVRSHNEAGKLIMQFQFSDGSTLQQTWELSADKHRLTVSEQWKPFGLQQPVYFKRSYVGLG
ncbi:hypothetical protein [Dyella sp. GSA-30]|uniref:hypothetical protein n=1 Tax=Dyella sp. GSA-30 TaxID=2994496 RepID=UPI0024912FB8|nr:hypothetical protein [Dyella sp. GSA-30]BDU22702.1 hypothetical protein DYGSA30_41590 [Dyella sp. GSA-30]